MGMHGRNNHDTRQIVLAETSFFAVCGQASFQCPSLLSSGGPRDRLRDSLESGHGYRSARLAWRPPLGSEGECRP